MKPNTDQRVILVLGIHRSGTSVLTKGLETMGILLGDSLSPATSLNEKGSWEDVAFRDFNVTMLCALGASTQRVLPLTEEETIFLCQHGFLEKASQLLLQKLSCFKRLGIKDPKFSILLPFWKKVFHACGVHISFVISLRDPWSVSSSSKACFNVKDQEKVFWCWISYLLSCLEYSEGYERVLVNYQELLKHPEHQMKRVAHALRLALDQEQLKTYCHDFIDASLCHFQEEERPCIDSFYKQFAMEIYGELLAIAKDQSSFHALKEPLAKWRKQFLEAHALLVLLEKNNITIQELEQTIMQREQTIFELNTTINEKLNIIARCYQAMHQSNLQMASLIQTQPRH